MVRSTAAMCRPCSALSLTTSSGSRPRACRTGAMYRGPEAVAQNVFGPITEDVDGFTLVREEFMASDA
jgi:hypothetical protein